jgi:hypothetical protein
MEAVILTLIQQLNSSVFILILVLILCILLAYKLGGVVTYFTETKSKNEKIDGKVDAIKDVLAKVQATTDLLYQAHLSTVQAHSPIQLTQKGEQISKAISAEMKIDNHWETIKGKLEEKKPTNAYDIQTVAMDIARDCFEKIFTPAEQNEIKTYAFGIGINLLEIYPIFGVIIRDRIFSERKVAIEEVDKHDPKNPKAV